MNIEDAPRLAGEHLRCRFCRSVMRFPMKTNLLGVKSGLFWLAVGRRMIRCSRLGLFARPLQQRVPPPLALSRLKCNSDFLDAPVEAAPHASCPL
jgi:hypothetical protein